MSLYTILPLAYSIIPLSASNITFDQINPRSIVSDACASYSTLDQLNSEVSPILKQVTQDTDFFAYYRLNLFDKECPFWNDANSMCGNIACAVTTLENESDIPPIWRAEELSKLEGPKAEHPGRKLQAERGPKKPLQGELGEDVGESCVVEYDDECDERDYCVPEDESGGSKGDYVSLVDNPERFTGYSGDGPHMVWNAIYRENCFSKESFPASADVGRSQALFNPASSNLKSVLFKPPVGGNLADLGFENEEECLEKRVFYRVISGMHASISAHLCYDYLNQSNGLWSPNVTCYKSRLHTYPERISNLYFNYALVTRAVAKLGPYLKSYTFCSGDVEQDRLTKQKVQLLTDKVATVPNIFDESVMFVNGEGPALKEDFRSRFRNVSRLMDCVGCDKCRLWGKVQTAGYGAALKVLFEFQEDGKSLADFQPRLGRTELVALVNTLARISSSISAIEKFRDMIELEECEDQEGHYHRSTSKAKEDDVPLDQEELEMEAIRAALKNAKMHGQANAGIGQQIWDEIIVVYQVTVHILKSYSRLPGVL